MKGVNIKLLVKVRGDVKTIQKYYKFNTFALFMNCFTETIKEYRIFSNRSRLRIQAAGKMKNS